MTAAASANSEMKYPIRAGQNTSTKLPVVLWRNELMGPELSLKVEQFPVSQANVDTTNPYSTWAETAILQQGHRSHRMKIQ